MRRVGGYLVSSVCVIAFTAYLVSCDSGSPRAGALTTPQATGGVPSVSPSTTDAGTVDPEPPTTETSTTIDSTEDAILPAVVAMLDAMTVVRTAEQDVCMAGELVGTALLPSEMYAVPSGDHYLSFNDVTALSDAADVCRVDMTYTGTPP